MAMICITMLLIGFVVGMGTMAIAGAAGYEEGVNNAYDLGYEIGRMAQKEKDLNAIDEFEKRLKGEKNKVEVEGEECEATTI